MTRPVAHQGIRHPPILAPIFFFSVVHSLDYRIFVTYDTIIFWYTQIELY